MSNLAWIFCSVFVGWAVAWFVAFVLMFPNDNPGAGLEWDCSGDITYVNYHNDSGGYVVHGPSCERVPK